MSDERDDKNENQGRLIGAGSVLGVGIGAAVGAATGDLGTGIRIGAVNGVGLGMLVAGKSEAAAGKRGGFGRRFIVRLEVQAISSRLVTDVKPLSSED